MQFDVVLSIMGITYTNIDAVIDGIAELNKPQKVFFKSLARKSTIYRRNDKLFKLILPDLTVTDALLDAAWMAATAEDFE